MYVKLVSAGRKVQSSHIACERSYYNTHAIAQQSVFSCMLHDSNYLRTHITFKVQLKFIMSGYQKLTYSKQNRQTDYTGQQTGPNHMHSYVGFKSPSQLACPNCIMHNCNTFRYRSRTMLHPVLLFNS